MKAIKVLATALAVWMLIGLVGCAAPAENLTSDKELFDIGKELIKIQAEMVESEEYHSLMGGGINAIRETAAAGSYDSPSAVYSITLSDYDVLMRLFLNTESKAWKELSESLKEQMRYRVSIASLISQINVKYGGPEAAAYSMAFFSTGTDDIVLDQEKIFLYVFENGTPIAVYYRNSGATAHFLFLDKTDSAEDIQAVFAPYKCNVEKLNIK